MTANTPPESLRYEDVAAFMSNISDPEEIVAITSMRALIRIAEMQRPSLGDQIYKRVEGEFPPYRKKDILGVSFVPAQRIRREISSILDSSDDQDRKRALLILSKTAQLVESQRSMLAEIGTEQERRAIDSLLDVICAPHVSHLLSDTVLETALLSVSPTLATHLVTSLFAGVAMVDCDDRSEWHLVESENVNRLVHRLGSRPKPDVGERHN